MRKPQWEAQSRRAETDALSTIPDTALGRRDPGAEAPVPSGAQVDRILAAAVADAQRAKATFTRYELTRMINRYLPDYLGGLSGEQVMQLLDGLTTEALHPGGPAGIVLLTAPEMVPVPEAYRRADGLSLWRRHGADIYTTRATLDTEARLLHAAAQTGAARVEPEQAAALLGVDRARVEALLWREHAASGAAPDGRETAATETEEAPLSSAGLTDDQAQAAYGILTSGRAIDILVGAAGTGKTRTVTAIAEAWREAGFGRVRGLTVSMNAAHVLAAEGLAESHNFAAFLGKIKDSEQTRGHLPVRPGDLLVVDEASMVPTSDLAALEAIATRTGAKILLTGDTEQLSAPQAGGVLRLLADECGYYQLSTVQRFEQDWEREASLRLRAGDTEALAEYDQRGRILDGTREQMSDVAYQRWLADHLSGKASMLLVTTNAQAAEMSRRARDELVSLGLVASADLAELRDGNVAGVRDLIVARKNDRVEAGRPRRWLANRDVLQIDTWEEIGEARVAMVRRLAGRDRLTGEVRWSAPFELAEDYIERHVELAYAGNVHVAEGRTVDTAHLVVDELADRESFYVGMTRGRKRNTAYVATERARAADLSPAPRPAPALADPGASSAVPPSPHRLTVLASVLDRPQADRSATETMRQELESAASLATLAPIWTDVTRAHATRQYENTLKSLLAPVEWQCYEHDAERGTLTRLLRAADLAGHDVTDVLRHAVEDRDLTDAESIAAVLHHRVRRTVGSAEPAASSSYAERTLAIQDPEVDTFARDLARAMDERVSELGSRTAADRPAWALRYLGEVPADPIERAEWSRRAGAVAAYREERGYHDEVDAIGPAPGRGSPEQRTSWHAAYTALRMPDENREIAAAADSELWVRREAYARDAAWAPPYVVDELRSAHLAEDAYRADAVRAWHRADAATDPAEQARIRQEAEQNSALAQEVGGYREVLTEIAEARRHWHAATEPDRQQALAADAELRRRHPDLELPPLHPAEEPPMSTSEPEAVRDKPGVGDAESGSEAVRDQPDVIRDVTAALQAARKAEMILADRRGPEPDSDDVMRRRESEARREAEQRRSAVRQEPAPSQREAWLALEEPELEAGQ